MRVYWLYRLLARHLSHLSHHIQADVYIFHNSFIKSSSFSNVMTLAPSSSLNLNDGTLSFHLKASISAASSPIRPYTHLFDRLNSLSSHHLAHSKPSMIVCCFTFFISFQPSHSISNSKPYFTYRFNKKSLKYRNI